MFKMLYHVDSELVRVNNAQVIQVRSSTSPRGSVSAMKIKEEGGVCLMAQFDILERGFATGRTFYVASDCLVEVIDGNA